jgi:hypothetical protein
MTLTLAGADIRGYYAALGIDLPAWAHGNAATRCFANPEAHVSEDRHPSNSVDLDSGAWNCHGCGAHGGAYDAALGKGHTPRSAIELMITHGLIEPRARLTTARELSQRRLKLPRTPRAITRPFDVSDLDLQRWREALANRPDVIEEICHRRLWSPAVLHELRAGWDYGRLTIPIHDEQGRLQGVLRYRVSDTPGPKMIAAPGTRLGLIPHPSTETSTEIILTEGPPDMIAARSRTIPAIAVPGDHAWRDEWVPTLAGRTVTIVMDADPQGRAAALRIQSALKPVALAQVLDLAPGRGDGYDLTDWLGNASLEAIRHLRSPGMANHHAGIDHGCVHSSPATTGAHHAR